MAKYQEKECTTLTCSNAQPIFIGDRFFTKKHPFSECCEHEIICEIRKDNNCASGYGLYDIKTGEFIVNGAMACFRVDDVSTKNWEKD